MGIPFVTGKTSALDYFDKYNGSIGDVQAGDSQQKQQGDGQMYWYVYTLKQGKHVLIGPYETQQDAGKSARQKISGWSYKVIGFRTRNRAAAVQMLKHDISNGGTMSKALESMRHTV